MFFTVIDPGAPSSTYQPGHAYLVNDNWNDYWEFRTAYTLHYYDDAGVQHEIGWVKIGQFEMGPAQQRAEIPDTFDALDSRFFSLGQGENYYETLNTLPADVRDRVLHGLRDLAEDLALFERALPERVTSVSLLRGVTEESVRGRLNRLVRGDVTLTPFTFEYELPPPSPESQADPVRLSFAVVPESLPPSNVHVLIGRNGVGKTRCLHAMTKCLVRANGSPSTEGRFQCVVGEPFANLVSVTFSAFDPFGPLTATIDSPNAIGYFYVGLKSPRSPAGVEQPPKTLEQLTGDFAESVMRCRVGVRKVRWRKALDTLEADPLFREAEVSTLSELPEDEVFSEANRLYSRLSSGHKIVLLTTTRLIETVDERTLVLVDEPEAHLHPPLLAAFVRALSELLVQRNGVAIIATHSPVVLQEAPRSCVWILRRTGDVAGADRPEIETFGENVGILTREVFKLEVTHAGFHRLLHDNASTDNADYETVLARFGGHLGAEARAILRGMLQSRTREPEE